MQMITIMEAAQTWGLHHATIRDAIYRGAFRAQEARKSGGTWLISKEAMRRLYGPPNVPDDLVAVPKAAQVLGCHRTLVYYYLRRGVVPSRDIFRRRGRIYLTPAGIEKLRVHIQHAPTA